MSQAPKSPLHPYQIEDKDQRATIERLRGLLREYRNGVPDGEGGGVFHDECFADASRNVDTRCDTCKKVDALEGK